MELKYNLQHQVLANTAAIANLTTEAADIESDIDSIETNISGLSQRVANTETDIIDLNAHTLKRSVTATEPKIVSLATDGSQANLTLGTNLSITNGVLNVAGGGGGLYMHKVHAQHVSEMDISFSMYIMSTSQTPFTNAREIPNGAYLAEGTIYNGDLINVFQVHYIFTDSDTTVISYVGEDSGAITTGTRVDLIGDIEFTDEVSEL